MKKLKTKTETKKQLLSKPGEIRAMQRTSTPPVLVSACGTKSSFAVIFTSCNSEVTGTSVPDGSWERSNSESDVGPVM